MKLLVKTMAALQQEDKILEQFYSTLANRENTSITLSLDPNTTNTTSNDQEFNYKMAAHDLISPLSNQYMLLGLLYEECTEAKERLDKVLQNAGSIILSSDESIKKVRSALSNHPKEHERTPISFAQLMETIVQTLSIKELYKHIDLSININTQKEFYNNIAIVQSIIQNLLTNAIKYGKPNQKNTIAITINDTDNGIEIIIQDTGIGMDKERVSKLFKQVVESHVGVNNSHGFGLYGVAQYVAKLGGTIVAESTLGVGSTFTVNLPSITSAIG